MQTYMFSKTYLHKSVLAKRYKAIVSNVYIKEIFFVAVVLSL